MHIILYHPCYYSRSWYRSELISYVLSVQNDLPLPFRNVSARIPLVPLPPPLPSPWVFLPVSTVKPTQANNNYVYPFRIREKVKLVLKATRQHARNLATFALIWKGVMLALRNINPTTGGKEGRYDSFMAGLVGGYVVFGRHKTSITQQVGIPRRRDDIQKLIGV